MQAFYNIHLYSNGIYGAARLVGKTMGPILLSGLGHAEQYKAVAKRKIAGPHYTRRLHNWRGSVIP